jgi:hypothetical protein
MYMNEPKPLNEELPPGYSTDGLRLEEGQQLSSLEPLFIAPPPDKSEEAVLNLDQAIDRAVSSFEEIERSVAYLKTKLEHPDQLTALNEMQALIDEALAPYLDELAEQYRRITDA